VVVTKYKEVADLVRGMIKSGELGPGDVVPTEVALATRTGHHRQTVRAGLEILQNEGLIRTDRAKRRRYVMGRQLLQIHASNDESRGRTKERRVHGIDVWTADVRAAEHEPGQIITVEVVLAGGELVHLARLLELPPGTQLCARHRVRTIDGEPHDLCTTYYPMDIAAGSPIMSPVDVTEGVIAYMEGIGWVQTWFEDTIEARMPDEQERYVLRMKAGIPLMIQTRTGYCAEHGTESLVGQTGYGRPVKVTITSWPGDRTQLVYGLPG